MPVKFNKKTLCKILNVAAVLGVLSAGTLTPAQEVKPGPEHELFKEWEGTWDATIKTMAGESKGTMTWKVDLNGLWLLEHFQQGDIGSPFFQVLGAMSYDSAKKKYNSIWINSMSTRPTISDGTYDKATKTMTMAGNMPLPDGKDRKITFSIVTNDANTKTFTMRGIENGKEVEMFQVTYKRRTK